jgi:hypothetical protein
MASFGFFNWEKSNFLGMFLRKYKYNTIMLALKENKSGKIIFHAYCKKLIPKKSADTILTRLLTTNGSDVVSAINPLAMMNGKITFPSEFRFRNIAKTMGHLL